MGEELKDGCRVRVYGLVGSAHLNGATGSIAGDLTGGRFAIRLSGPPQCVKEHPKGVRIQPQNLEAIPLQQQLPAAAHVSSPEEEAELMTLREAVTASDLQYSSENEVNGHTLNALNALALRLGQAGRHGEALPIFQRVLTILEDNLGEDHAYTIDCMDAVSRCLLNLTRYEEALPLCVRAAEAQAIAVGAEHPDTIAAAASQAACLMLMDRSEEALVLYQRILKVSERLRPTDIETISLLNMTANCLSDLGRPGEAVPLFDHAVAVSKRTLGADHPETITSSSNLAVALQRVNREFSDGQVQGAVAT